jgi:hypothetical protein
LADLFIDHAAANHDWYLELVRFGLGSQGSNSCFPPSRDAVDSQFDFIINGIHINQDRLALLTWKTKPSIMSVYNEWKLFLVSRSPQQRSYKLG